MTQLTEEQKPKWDKSGLKEACQRGLAIGRTRQEFDLQLLLDMLLEIERLESSLIDSDSQAVAANYPKLAHDIISEYNTADDPGLLRSKVAEGFAQVASDVASAMRDKCVEKLHQVRDNHLVSNNEHYEKGFNAALKCAELAMRSLTLDQVKPGEV